MEPRGCNSWQPLANRSRGEAAKTSESCCRRLRPVAERSAWQGGGLRFESGRGLCKSPARRRFCVHVDLHVQPRAVGMEPIMELSGREVCSPPSARRRPRRPRRRNRPGTRQTLACNRDHSRGDTVGEEPGSSPAPRRLRDPFTHSPARAGVLRSSPSRPGCRRPSCFVGGPAHPRTSPP
jgi:hypothetical protein